MGDSEIEDCSRTRLMMVIASSSHGLHETAHSQVHCDEWRRKRREDTDDVMHERDKIIFRVS